MAYWILSGIDPGTKSTTSTTTKVPVPFWDRYPGSGPHPRAAKADSSKPAVVPGIERDRLGPTTNHYYNQHNCRHLRAEGTLEALRGRDRGWRQTAGTGIQVPGVLEGNAAVPWNG